MEFVRGCILGAGSSASTPCIRCVLSDTPCVACTEALHNPLSRHHRLNASFLLQLRHPVDGTIHNILIDCGKTFRESALKVFPTWSVRDISAVLLTHDHADATFGIDDLRDLNRSDTSTDIFVDDRTMASMRRMYGYLFPKDSQQKTDMGEGEGQKATCIASVHWAKFTPLQRLDMHIRSRAVWPKSYTEGEEDTVKAVSVPFSVVPVAVPHGIDYYANAFLIPMHNAGEEPRLLLYVSDVSKVEEKFFDDIAQAKTLLGVAVSTRIEVLILDMMSYKEYFAHLHVDASIKAAKSIDAIKTFFIGIAHSLDHNVLTQQLEDIGLADRMSIGFDGCVVAEGRNALEKKDL